MNKLLLASAALIVLTGVGQVAAADLSPPPVYKAPVPVMLPIFNWTGFYIGANIGGSFGKADSSVALAGGAVGNQSVKMDGVVGGGQVGYNQQIGVWLWGVEADLQGTSQRGSGSASNAVNIPGRPLVLAACDGNLNCIPDPIAVTGNLAYSEKLPWFGTVRGRLGFTPADRWLLYVTGGLAYGQVDTNGTLTVGAVSASSGFNNTRAGWTAGVGVEAALWGRWTGKLEYLYVNLGSTNNNLTGLGVITPVTISSHVTDNIVRVGLNYHF